MTSVFYIPAINVIGLNSLNQALDTARDYGYKSALIVTDIMLAKLGMAEQLQQSLAERNIKSVVFDGTHPNSA